MGAAWASVIVSIALVALGLVGVAIGMAKEARETGRREGKIDEVLETLTAMVDDHEKRLRRAEGRHL